MELTPWLAEQYVCSDPQKTEDRFNYSSRLMDFVYVFYSSSQREAAQHR